jgi:hypothetical protein
VAFDLSFRLLLWETTKREVFVSYTAPDHLAERYGPSDQEAGVMKAGEAVSLSVVRL